RVGVDDAGDETDGGILVDGDEARHIGNLVGELRDEGAVDDRPGKETGAAGDGRPGPGRGAARAAGAVGVPDEAGTGVAARERELVAGGGRPERARRLPRRVGEREVVGELHTRLRTSVLACGPV